ncbi:ataxin-2 homolog isoform X1 [Diabrotica virgifera virgifera]|uniref:Ataxin-2 homolog isoform X1 n=1 Tax=Diabrotica virgifera virgifera TaxID=50390 RepID=A0A6P7GEZ5_DIAVI|nr:ataxin-2 homolog isoform X1 [Diabrotica virgifera virgifera]
MNNKRKNRGGPVRTQRPSRSVVSDGVYNNAHFMHASTGQIGNVVRITTASGVVWEGVFKTFSSRFDVVLEVAAKVENPDSPNSQINVDTYVDKLIFKACDILTMVAQDVDLEYPIRDTFQTDTAISARLNGSTKLEERELEPWDSSGMNGTDIQLELDQANGWDANDMFRKNEQDYGVQSTFDQSLRGYTVPLQTSDSADYKEAEAKANMIANEIENQPQHKARLELENGDEEAAFASVVRPNQDSSTNGKYIPPAKRKNQNNGKLVRSTPPPSQSNSNQNTPSPKETRPPMTYPTLPSPHQTNVHVQQVLPQHQPPPHMHNATVHSPPMSMQPHVIPPPNHPRPHSHTPPHQYQPPVQSRPPPPQTIPQQPPHQPKAQMNGEAKVPPRQQRVYQSQQYPPPEMKPDIPAPHQPRHREDTMKDLHQFSQDFKLAPMPTEQPPPQMQPPPPVVEQVVQPVQQILPNKPPQQPSPPQPQQSISPQQENLDKVTNTLKKSTLNPNAKEFVLNPSAKPFQPSIPFRSPSTPSASRPHTPQTPSHSPYIPATVGGPAVQPPMQVMMPLHYVMTSQPQYQPPPQGNKIRRLPMRTDMASQMQVAAATGQPLLAPAPIQPFIYPPAMNQAYQPMHMVRTYETSPQIQYIPPNPHPSQTPSPAQPPQYNPAQGPQAPPQQCQAAPPPPQSHHQFPLMYHPIIPAQPHMMQSMQYLPQAPPPPQPPMQVLMHQHPGQGNPHGPNP